VGGASGLLVGVLVGVAIGVAVGVPIAATCAKPKKKNTAVAKIISERTEFNTNL